MVACCMSNLPEFIQPFNKHNPQKPQPKEGLAEFLREKLAAQTEQLSAVATPHALMPLLAQHAVDIVSLIEHAKFLGGHHIFDYDLPYLHQLLPVP